MIENTFDWKSKPMDSSLDSLKKGARAPKKVIDSSVSPYYRLGPTPGLSRYKKLKLKAGDKDGTL